MLQTMLSTLALGFLLLLQGPMFRSQNYNPVSSVKTQVFTESFAYTTNTDLVTDAPSKWQYNGSGFGFEVSANSLFAWQTVADVGNSFYPAIAQYIGTGTINANQYATTTLPVLGSVEIGPGVRISGTSAYVADCYSGGCRIVKFTSGVDTNLTSFGATVANGAVIELDATGSSPVVLTLLVNGSNYASFTDTSSPFSTGSVGIVDKYGSNKSGSDTYISNVTGGNL